MNQNWVPTIGGPFAEPLAQVRQWADYNRLINSENQQNALRVAAMRAEALRAASQDRQNADQTAYQNALRASELMANRELRAQDLAMRNRDYAFNMRDKTFDNKMDVLKLLDARQNFKARMKEDAAKRAEDTKLREEIYNQRRDDAEQKRTEQIMKYSMDAPLDMPDDVFRESISGLPPTVQKALVARRTALVRGANEEYDAIERKVAHMNAIIAKQAIDSEGNFSQDKFDNLRGKYAKEFTELSNWAEIDPDKGMFRLAINRPTPKKVPDLSGGTRTPVGLSTRSPEMDLSLSIYRRESQKNPKAEPMLRAAFKAKYQMDPEQAESGATIAPTPAAKVGAPPIEVSRQQYRERVALHPEREASYRAIFKQTYGIDP